ncbi:glutamate synthase-related protein [Wenzhouxiangella sp. EGI_FJ10409]|uniref:glutamate synthase-related protein n=1 Tax=Wenzhouxiangella sp. EGI_FJ10409 TaxID=3243767 RepID=UPI0035DCFAD4
MSEQPVVAALSPQGVKVEKGETYFWCRCGRSKNQPFCDGSHEGTGITPVEFEADKDEELYFCRCKATGDQPLCDGTHAKLDVEVGDPVPEDALKSSDDDGGDGDNAPEAEATPEEPTVARIHEMARHGLEKSGPHGETVAMGVPRSELPDWNDIQILTAQLARKPLEEEAVVDTRLVIGPKAERPLELDIPLFVSDMSFGALSPEAKIALARGAEMAGTGICSGEGGSMDEEREANSRYLLELASAMFGWRESLLDEVRAFHFKGGQAAKTGTGGHLPGSKVTDKIAETRGIEAGKDAVSPATFEELRSARDFRRFGDRVRERSGGIPVGFKLSANHIEDDIDFALDAGADYIILDGRGGGTGAAPAIFRDHISVPTIPALARARRHMDKRCGRDVTLIVTGGLRTPEDFAKAIALGADGVALANSAIQAIGCVAARICHTNRCPSGVATQDPKLRKRLKVDQGAERLARFFDASVHLMAMLARACGHSAIADFSPADLTTFKRDMARLSGVAFGGVADS